MLLLAPFGRSAAKSVTDEITTDENAQRINKCELLGT